MGESFGQAVSAWTTFYQFTGGVAGTLLGLLFAAITLRREVFQHPGLAYVRDFIAVTLEILVAALLVAALAFAPHTGPWPLALGLIVVAGAGLLGLAGSVRQWARSAIARRSAYPEGWTPHERRGQLLIVLTALPFVAMLGAAAVIGRWGPAGLGALALAQISLLLVAMISTWAMIAQASAILGAEATPPTAPTNSPPAGVAASTPSRPETDSTAA